MMNNQSYQSIGFCNHIATTNIEAMIKFLQFEEIKTRVGNELS